MYEIWQIETTTRCDLECRHCLIGGDTRKRGLIEGNLMDVVDRIVELGGSQIGFTGGEPFMVDDFLDVCIYARSLKISLAFITNGQISSTISPKLIADAVEIVGVSIDGTAEVHDYIRGAGAYDRAMIFIKNMLESNVHVVAYVTVNGLNISRFEDVLSELVNAGVRAFHINQLNIQGNALKNQELHLNYTLSEIRATVMDAIHGITDDLINLEADYSCSIGKHSVYLDCMGNIYPCVELSIGGYHPIASIFDDEVKEKMDSYFAKIINPASCSYETLVGNGMVIEFNIGSCPLLVGRKGLYNA